MGHAPWPFALVLASYQAVDMCPDGLELAEATRRNRAAAEGVTHLSGRGEALC